MSDESMKHEIRHTEIARLRALVEIDLPRAELLHADKFELVTPYGSLLSKKEYLSAIESSDLDYKKWEPCSEIMITLFSDQAAVIRYLSILEVNAYEYEIPALNYWHTDTYEKNAAGQWQVVWSQATQVQQ